MEDAGVGLIDFSSIDLGAIDPVDLEMQNAFSSWLADGNTGTMADFQAETSSEPPTDLTTTAETQPEVNTIAAPGLLASVLDPKPMIRLEVPGTENPSPPRNIPDTGIAPTPFAPLFVEKANEYGISPRYLDRTAAVESRYDPTAQNPRSSAGGLFQFINGTARDYNLTDRFDPVQATDAAARLARDNAASLRNVLGRDPTDGELYLAHQQGAGGAIKILTNPGAPMESLVGSEAARLNGGAGLTGAQFAQKFISKIEGGASSFAPTSNAGGAPQPYQDRMAGIGAFPMEANAFTPMRSGNITELPTTAAERPGMLGDLISPEQTLPGAAPLSNQKAIPGAIDPGYTYQDTPGGRALPRAPEPTARDMVASARPGAARQASISDPRADNPAVRSATTQGGRAMMPVMQEDLTSRDDAGARQFATAEAARGGPLSFFGSGQEIAQPAAGGASAPAGADVPAAGSAPVQASAGGAVAAPAAGGGFKMSPIMSDFFLALGSSLLSSPKGQPLAGFGKTFAALQIASQDTNKTQQQQAVLAAELTRSGIPASEAVSLASNPTAAKMALERIQLGKQQAEDVKANKAMVGAGFSDQQAQPATVAATAPQQSEPIPAASQSSAPQPVPASSEQRVQMLLKRREQVVKAAMENPSEKNRQSATMILGQIDKEIAQVGGGEGGKYSKTPAWGVDTRTGKPVMLQPGGDGTVARSQLPEGVELANKPIEIDTRTATVLLDPQTRQVIQTIPKDIAGAKAQEKIGEAQGDAVTGLGKAEATASDMLKSIDGVMTHRSRDEYGALGKLAAAPLIGSGLPGTGVRDFVERVDQIKGQAFLEAFNSLKGGGAITEQEGKAATSAMARLDRAKDPKDFDTALNDLRAIVERGLERARARAGGGQASQPASAGSQQQKSSATPPSGSPLDEARSAIARGAPKEAVAKRLRDAGIDPSGL